MGGAAKTVSTAAANPVGAITSGLKKAGGLAGTGTSAGILGVGQYKGEKYDYDEEAFKNKQASDEMRSKFAQELERSNRATPTTTGATIDTSRGDQFRDAQQRLVGDLEAQSRGEGPSIAQDQLERARGQNIAQAMALQASQRGANVGAARRQIARSTDAANIAAARDAASARIQEQLAARGQLAGVAGQARGQDLSTATTQAQLGQQAALANQQAELAARAQNDQLRMSALQNQAALNQYDQSRQMRLEELRGQQTMGQQQLQAGAYESAAQRRAGLIGGAGEGLAAIALSDENKKKNVSDLSFDKYMASKSGGMTQTKAGASPLERLVSGEGPQMSTKEDGQKIKTEVDEAATAEDAGFKYKPAGENASGHQRMGKAAGAGIAAALSDENKKTMVVKPDDKKVQSFVDALQAYQYEYKDPEAAGAGEGEYISPMAQDMEKSELGENMVSDTDQGKMVNYGKAGGLMLATAAMLNDKMQSIEKQLEQVWREKKGKK